MKASRPRPNPAAQRRVREIDSGREKVFRQAPPGLHPRHRWGGGRGGNTWTRQGGQGDRCRGGPEVERCARRWAGARTTPDGTRPSRARRDAAERLRKAMRTGCGRTQHGRVRPGEARLDAAGPSAAGCVQAEHGRLEHGKRSQAKRYRTWPRPSAAGCARAERGRARPGKAQPDAARRNATRYGRTEHARAPADPAKAEAGVGEPADRATSGNPRSSAKAKPSPSFQKQTGGVVPSRVVPQHSPRPRGQVKSTRFSST
jgi:hypothetical protein